MKGKVDSELRLLSGAVGGWTIHLCHIANCIGRCTLGIELNHWSSGEINCLALLTMDNNSSLAQIKSQGCVVVSEIPPELINQFYCCAGCIIKKDDVTTDSNKVF